MNILYKIIHLFQRFYVQTGKVPNYIKNFGVKVTFYIILDRLFPPGRSKRYQKVVYQYLDSQFQEITKKYQNRPKIIYDNQIEKPVKIIWVCWLQGEENMPELVRMCYNNLKNKVTDSDIKIILLSHGNINQYVDIPEYIRIKYKKGFISNAHFSDILRFKLLRKYGGCWMDSTIFVTQPINESLFVNKFNTLKMHQQLCPKEPCKGLWSGFFIAGQKELSIFRIIDDCLDDYWQKHTEFIDYIMLDYLMLVAYNNNHRVKGIMDSVPFNNENLWFLWNNIERPFSHQLFNKICNSGQFYKLSYQKLLKKEIQGKQTVYGYLVSESHLSSCRQ